MRKPESMDGYGPALGMVRLHIDVPLDTYEAVRRLAEKDGVDFTEAHRRMVKRGSITLEGKVSSPVSVSPCPEDLQVLLVSVPMPPWRLRYKWMSLFRRKPVHTARVQVSAADRLTDRRLVVERDPQA